MLGLKSSALSQIQVLFLWCCDIFVVLVLYLIKYLNFFYSTWMHDIKQTCPKSKILISLFYQNKQLNRLEIDINFFRSLLFFFFFSKEGHSQAQQ